MFSWLNNLKDLTLNKEIWELVWFSLKEVKDNFQYYINWEDWKNKVDLNKLEKRYNWFNFLSKEKVFNPFDILLFLDSKEYKNYWFETATPTFLITLLKEYPWFYHIPDLQNTEVWEEIIWSFDIEKINLETLLFQTWYLTIKEKTTKFWNLMYKLQVPNFEIKTSLNKYLISDYLWAFNMAQFTKRLSPIYDALIEWNIEEFINWLKSVFAWISYTNRIEKLSKYEWYYSSIIYVMSYAMWLDVIQEDITNQWRIDLTIEINNNIYILEFKVEQSWNSAMEQIKEKKYYEKYLNEKKNWKKVFLVWINFSMEDRNIESFEWEEK